MSHLLLLLFIFFKKNRTLLLLSFICLIVANLEIVLRPYIIKLIVDSTNYSDIKYLTLVYLVITIFNIIALRIFTYIVNVELLTTLRLFLNKYITEDIISRKYEFFQNHASTKNLIKIVECTNSTVEFIKNILCSLCSNILVLTYGIICLFTTQKQIFAILLLSWTFICIICSYFFSKKITSLSGSFVQSIAESYSNFGNIMSNILLVKVFANENSELKNLSKKFYDIFLKEKLLKKYYQHIALFYGSSFILLQILVISYSLFYLNSYLISVGDFIQILFVNSRIYTILRNFLNDLPQLSESYGKASNAFDSLELQYDRPNTDIVKKQLACKSFNIKFESAKFSFNDTKKFQFDNIIFKHGSKWVITGDSGSGKTTLVLLIIGLYKNYSGKIYLGEHEIKNLSGKMIGSFISYVPQDAMFFNRSIKNNICYGIKNYTSQYKRILKITYLNEFINSLKEGDNTLIQNNGVNFSGGQRQQIAIARALMQNKRIIIFDEATNQIDSTLTKKILKSILRYKKTDTIIFISHDSNIIESFKNQLIVKDRKPYITQIHESYSKF